MSAVTLVGGRVVDPASGRDGIANVCIEGRTITAVGREVIGEPVDVTGCIVAPGLVDLHVHFREPGAEDSETIATGAAAAAAGGFTAVCAMANTDPVVDTPELVSRLSEIARGVGLCDVFQIAAITRGLAGEELVDFEALARVGVRYFSDDGHPVASAAIMREALARAAAAGGVVGNHAEEPTLTCGAQANDGPPVRAVGMRGWPHEAEEVMVARDVLLAEGTGARLHVPHASTAATVDIIRWAKQRGMSVTAEATPHHFALTDELVHTMDPTYKVNPPLRRLEDVEAIRTGLRDGTLDAIATDHAPHSPTRKGEDWRRAPFGMLGLETALSMTLTHLVEPGHLTLSRAIAVLAYRPARAMGLASHGGPLVAGVEANLVVIDPSARWTVDREALHSRSRNTPFDGFELQGRPVHTLLRGSFTMRDGEVRNPGDPGIG